MEDKIEISVILTSYNSNWEKMLRTLVSILAQKNVDYEIVFADDGSIDYKKERIEYILSLYNFERFTFSIQEKIVEQ